MVRSLILCAFVALFAMAAFAQEAPVPRRAPRTPVDQHSLAPPKSVLESRMVEGPAVIMDGGSFRIGEINLRLFGIVPPQLSASFGPQARALFDNVTAGQNLSCQVRDRDHEGRFLATCRAGSTDPALELVRRGLAVTARGTLTGTELAVPYLAAEQAAQAQKIGLWSGVVTPAAKIETPAPVSAKIANDNAPVKAVEASVPPPAPVVTPIVVPPAPAPVAEVKKEVAVAAPVAAEAAAHVVTNETLAASLDETTVTAVDEPPGFLARYQVLVTGLVMLITAMGTVTVVMTQRRRERRDEVKAIAAALRGELMAARAVCLTRAKAILNENDDRAATWPRIRSTLYSAYVGRIGWLGAELARQVASIYGQTSDYASYFNSEDDGRVEAMPKRQALHNLIRYIEEVLPKLAMIEQNGRLLHAVVAPSMAMVRAPSYAEVEAPAPEVKSEAARAEINRAEVRAQVARSQSLTKQTVTTQTVTETVSETEPVWTTVRNLTNAPWLEGTRLEKHIERSGEDYTALIEQEMAEAAETTPPPNKNGKKKKNVG